MACGTLIGLDLSIRSTGWCLMPDDWNGSPWCLWAGTIKTTKGSEDDADSRAIATIVDELVEKVRVDRPEAVGIESLPTVGFSVVRLARLHGALRYALRGTRIIEVPQMSARKLFLGKLPKKDLKTVTVKTVQSLSELTGYWGPDECDAFVVANYLSSELGGQCLIGGGK